MTARSVRMDPGAPSAIFAPGRKATTLTSSIRGAQI